MQDRDNDEFDVRIFKRPKVKEVQPHTHKIIELVYIYKGEGELRINDKVLPVNKGNMLFYNIGELHSLNAINELNAINIQIHPKYLDNSITGTENFIDILTLSWFNEFSFAIDEFKPVISFEGKQQLEMDSIVIKMLEEYKEKDNGYKSIIFGYLTILFAMLFRQLESKTKLNIRQDMFGISSAVLLFIDKNYNKKITLEELAKKSFYETSYFSTVFKECFGVSPIKYINSKRIEKAKDFLKNTSESIEKVIYSVGFVDRKHFYKIFKEETGMTPGAYREKSKNTLQVKKD